MFPLGFWFGFEVRDKASQEIQALFAIFFGIFWIVFLSKVHLKSH